MVHGVYGYINCAYFLMGIKYEIIRSQPLLFLNFVVILNLI